MQTATQALASELLGEDVNEWIRDLRSQDRPRWSWRLIAEELTARTDSKVNVSGEAIRQWVSKNAEQVAS